MISERRYPGSRPFQDNALDRRLFRGRESEKSALLHLILAEDLVLLYAKSGMGKTSLLNAGVMQALRDREYCPFTLRLDQPDRDPIALIQQQVAEQAARSALEVQSGTTPGEHLWRFFHDLRLWQGDILLTPVLVFDQFEELFTLWREKERKKFIGQFADLARDRCPEDLVARPGEEVPEKAPPLKMVLSMREDYLGELELVAAEVPQVMYNRFRLTALSREQAEMAIREPAELTGEDLPGRQFQYQLSAIEAMLGFLCARRDRKGVSKGNEVEPFQLQILCQHIEEKVLQRQRSTTGVVKVTPMDLGGQEGMETILQQFYNRQIAQIPGEHQEVVRRLCERGLISETEKRLSLEEEDIELRFKVGKAVLEKMVELRLLRAEPRVGSVYYELSHDTLVAPILRDRKGRDPDAIFRQAEEDRIRFNYDKAIEGYGRVIQLDPNHTLAYLQWAGLLMFWADFKKAQEVLEQAIRQGLENASVFHMLGQALMQRGEHKQAIKNYQKAIDLNSELPSLHIDLGDAYKSDKQPAKAVEAYEKAISLDRKNSGTFERLAQLHIENGDYPLGVEVFRRAIEADNEFAGMFDNLVRQFRALGAKGSASSQSSSTPRNQAKEICLMALNTESSDANLYFRIGYELGELEQYGEAILACEKSSTLNDELPATYNNWGYYLQKVGKPEEGIEKLRRALEIDPAYSLAFVNWVGCLWDQGRREEAVELCRSRVATRPDDFEAYFRWGWSLGELARHEEAIEKYEKAIALNPKDAKSYTNCGWNLGRLGRHQEAIEKYEKAAALDPQDAPTYNNWGYSLRKLGRQEEGIEKLRRALEIEPKYSFAFINWIDCLWDLGRREEALEVCQKRADANPDDSDAYFKWGWSLGELGRNEEAVEKYEKAIALNPKDAKCYTNCGWYLSRLGRYEEAVEKYEKATVLNPQDAPTYNNLAYALRRLGRQEEGIEKLRRALEIEPKYRFAFINWIDCLWDLGRREEALEVCQKRAEANPEDFEAYFKWGWTLGELGRYQEAIEKYEKATGLNPKDASSYTNWGWSLGELGRDEEAIEKYQQATALDPKDAHSYNNWGYALQKLGKHDEAIEMFRRTVEIDPKHSLAYANWAVSLWKLERWEEVVALYSKAAVVNPNDAQVYISWGWVLSELGRFEEAVEKIQRAIEIDPADSGAWSRYAIMLAKSGQNEKAREMLLKAIELQPRTSSDLVSIGWGFYLNGDYDTSIEWSRKALAMDSQSLNAQCNLALATLRLGRLDEAKQQYEEVIQLALKLNAAEQLRESAINDLEEALQENPQLPGGKAALEMVQKAYDEMLRPVPEEIAPAGTSSDEVRLQY